MTRSRKSTTLWNLVFNFFTVFYAVASGIVLVPLYLKYIPLDVYGAWLATGNVVAWIGIIDPGVSSVLMQRVSAAYGRQDMAALSWLLTGGLLASLVVAAVILGAGLGVGPYLPGLLGLEDSPKTRAVIDAFDVAILSTSVMILAYGLAAFNQGMQSSLGIGIIFATTNVAGLVLTVWLLLSGHGLMAIPLAMLFRSLCLVAANGVYLIWCLSKENIRVQYSLRGFRELAELISFNFLGRTAGTLVSNIEAIVVTRQLGPEMAPVLALTRRAPDLGRTFLERPAIAFMPAVSNLYGTGSVDPLRTVLLRLARIILWITGLACTGFLLLNASFVDLWVGKALYAGNSVNLVIALELAILVFMSVLTNLCFALGNIKGNSLATLAYSALAIPLMFVGARTLGLLGVAMAPLVAMTCTVLWYYPRAFSKLLKLGAEDKRAMAKEAMLVLISSSCTLGSLFWIQPSNWGSFCVAIAATSIVYLGSLYFLSRPFRVELAAAIKTIRTWFTRQQ